MKLVVAIVHDRDVRSVTDCLVDEGHRFTKIGSTGGFLREGNTTFLIGCEPNDVDGVMTILQERCKSRQRDSNILPPDALPIGVFTPNPVKITVGGAVVFVIDVERCERF